MPAEALLSRAIEYVEQRGSASPAELARHVFGGDAFAPLLASLNGERLHFDGALWRLAPPTDELAFLEILATGPNPRRHRVVEIAAQCGSTRFHAHIASKKPVPKLLQSLGVPLPPQGEGLGEGSWCSLDQARNALRTFVGQSTVAGFGYVPEYLDQLLGPRWPAIDLLRLLRAEGYRGRPDPVTVARRFGLTPPLGRRPLAMLGFSQALFERLGTGRPLVKLRELARPVATALPDLPELPSEPGVYVMSGSDGLPLYVGKSVDLKRRVGSYLRSPIALSRNMPDLLQLSERIEIIPMDRELEALLLEQQLIREWLPAFNVQRRSRERRLYLRLSIHEPFPRLSAAAEPRADGALYFGPFRHATAPNRLRAILGSVLRLRSCTRQLPSRRKPRPPCPKAASGDCLAPCVAGPPPSPYVTEVELAKALLNASPEEFRRLLRRLLLQRPSRAPAKLKRQLQSLA